MTFVYQLLFTMIMRVRKIILNMNHGSNKSKFDIPPEGKLRFNVKLFYSVEYKEKFVTFTLESMNFTRYGKTINFIVADFYVFFYFYIKPLRFVYKIKYEITKVVKITRKGIAHL